MSRTRITKGTYTKISAKVHNMYSQTNINSYAAKSINEHGVKNGEKIGNPSDPPETPMLWKPQAELQGDVIFCNGFHSSPIGAVNAALNVTIGMEPKNKHIPDGENTHHSNGEMDTYDTKTPVKPDNIDEDILSSDEVKHHENSPQEQEKTKYFPYPRTVKEDTLSKETLTKFKGYWNDITNKNEAIDLYTSFFNAEKRDNYINGSHGMGSPAWERECHGITLGYYWAKKNWNLRSKEAVEKEKEKNPNAESYSPPYRPLTFVGHSEGAAVAVGSCLGAMYYAAELGWNEVAINLVHLGIHQPVSFWSDEKYDENREQEGNYLTDYNTYKWFKKEVLEVTDNSPRLINELLANIQKTENSLTPYGPALAHIFTKDRNKQKYGIDEWTAQLLGTDNWNKLKKRAVQFTFANDRADTVMIDGDIPGIANAKSSEDDSTLFGWSKWNTSYLKGGLSPNSDLAITVSDFGQGYMDTRIKVKKENPEQVSYMKTTYESWTREFFEYHRKFKILAIEYEKKYKEKWETGEVYMDEKVILFNSKKALEYAKVKDSHTEMMTKYVWMHHIELEAHFAPVGFINRSEIFNLPDGKTRNPKWPENEGSNIWQRILKTSDKNDIFYRYDYNINFYGDLKKEILPELNKRRKNLSEQKSMREEEKDYIEKKGKKKLIDPNIAYNTEVQKWVSVAKDSLKWEDVFRKLKEKMEEQKKQYQRDMDEIDYHNRNPW